MKARLQALLARRWARATAIVVAMCGTIAATYAFSYACVRAASWMDEHYALPVSYVFVELAAATMYVVVMCASGGSKGV